jgi:hypothetical protein
MAQAEKYSWASLATTAAIFLFFMMRMLGDDGSLAEQSAGRLVTVYISIVVLAIIAESVIAGVLAGVRGGSTIEKDERDHAIEAKANRNAFYFLCGAVNVIVVHALLTAVYPGRMSVFVDLGSTAGIFFALFSTLFAASIVKLVSIIVYYRTSG